jgi:GGDEF domain-containing protein
MDGETHRDIRRSRYALLARHRRVERRFEIVERRWEEFSDGPSPARLAVLRRSIAAADRELSLLAGALDGPLTEPGGEPPADSPSPSPSPRDLVEAGRELDALVNGSHQAWNATRNAPETSALMRIAEMLSQAEQAAGTLERALKALGEAGEHRQAEPGLADASPARRHEQSLDGLLSGLHAEWTALRRQPTLLKTKRLRGALAEARQQASALAVIAGSESALATPEALRYLGGASEAVRFPPYRDQGTGSYNGLGFEVSAAAEVDRCTRYGKPFGIIILSLASDRVASARRVIGAIQSILRSTDLVGRLPGDELVLALPESDGRVTRRIAARILRALDAADHGDAVNRLAYAVSPGEGRTLRELLDAARTRLEA